MRRLGSCVVLCVLFFASSVLSAAENLELRAQFGPAGFSDEGSVWNHFLIEGSLRWMLRGGFGIQPALTYYDGGRNDKDVGLAANVLYEWRRNRSWQPYVIGGAGLLLHWERAFPPGLRVIVSPSPPPPAPVRPLWRSKWSAGLTAGGGFGLKVWLSDDLYIGPEMRLGWEPVIRLGVIVGFRLK